MRYLIAIVLLPLFLLLSGGSDVSAAETLRAGVDYERITPPVPRSGTKPEVVEVFNFKCPHCSSLAPHTAEWAEKNKDRIDFRSVPVYWGKQTDIPVRAYFAAEFLGKGEAMKQAIFQAHFSNSADIENIEEMTFLAEATGMDAQSFRSQMNSFGVSAKISQAKALQTAFRASSTPTLVINGRYQVLPGRHARGGAEGVDYSRLFTILETLVNQ
ncbi:MAG: thiol:disulfide interchange protein DsbA/DsbL [Magnetococcales bacterium]|nr:thiol:disulfide interchange protein DsbA/DsbL [Magnetococcales bacterium]